MADKAPRRISSASRRATTHPPLGREDELSQLIERLGHGRLVTLVGPPAIGKTTLAVAVAAAVHDGVLQGMRDVFFIDLAGALSLDDVEARLVRGLRRARPGRSPLSEGHRWVNTLAERGPSLVILDECESVLQHVADVCAVILDEAPAATVLATSRERLDISDEVVLALGPLETPPVDERDPTIIAATAAVRLLVRTAAAIGGVASFEQTDMPVLGDLARRLEGIPLGLELCAARFSTLSPRQMLDRLARGDLSSSSRRGRHRSLDDAIRASWDLLEQPLRSVLMEVSLFDGSFTLEMAEAIVAAPQGLDVATALLRLRDKSLVQVERSGAVHFRLLAMVRAFARAELGAAAHASEARRRFAEHVVQLAEVAAKSSSPALALEELSPDLVSVVESEIEGEGPTVLALRGLVALAVLFRLRDASARFERLARRALELEPAGGASPSGHEAARDHLRLRIRVMTERADALAMVLRTDEGIEQAIEAKRLAASSLDAEIEIGAELALAGLLARAGRIDEARAIVRDANAKATSSGSATLRLAVLATGLRTDWVGGTIAVCLDVATQGLALAERARDAVSACAFRFRMASTYMAAGRFDDAERLLRKTTAEAERLGLVIQAVQARAFVANVALAKGDFALARGLLEASVDENARLGRGRSELWGRSYLGVLELLDGDEHVARERLEEASADADPREPIWLLVFLFGALAGSELASLLLAEGLEAARSRLEPRTWRALDRAAGAVAVLARGRSAVIASGDGKRVDTDQLRSIATDLRAETPDLPPAYAFDLALVACVVERKAAFHAANHAPRSASVEPSFGHLRVGPGARWFEVDGAKREALSGSPTSRRLLLRFMVAHRDAPGRGVTFGELREAAWPGDKSRPDAAANRLYVAITRLRDRGLRGLIVREDDGWLIHSGVAVAWISDDLTSTGEGGAR